MKKILSLILIVLLITTITACSVQKNEKLTETTKNTISTMPSENNSSTEEAEKFSYKMVEANFVENENSLNKGVLTYVFYTDAHFTEHSSFSIYTKDGVEISKYGNSENVFPQYETTYVCDECTLEHTQTTKHDDLKTHDRIIVVILSFKDKVYNFEDLIVKTTVYDDIETKTGEEIVLKANATMEDLRLNEKYLHSKSIIQDNVGNWFVCAPDGGSGFGSSGEEYKIISFTSFSNTTVNLEGDFEIVDKNGNTMEVPNGCQEYVELEFNSINFGLKSTEENTLLNLEGKAFIDEAHLKYTDKNGNVTFFFN